MVTDPNCALVLEIISCWCTVGVVYDHGGLTTLNDVYRYSVRAAEREDLGLAAPHRRITDAGAISRILMRADDPRVPRARTVLALDAREERNKVLWVRQHVLGCCSSRENVMRVLGRDDVEDGELICDRREETVAVWGNLCSGMRDRDVGGDGASQQRRV